MGCNHKDMTVRDFFIDIFQQLHKSRHPNPVIYFKGPDYCQMKDAWSRLLLSEKMIIVRATACEPNPRIQRR
jgi:hypothetical protein